MLIVSRAFEDLAMSYSADRTKQIAFERMAVYYFAKIAEFEGTGENPGFNERHKKKWKDL